MKNKLLIIPILIILCSFIVFSFSTHTEWGNGEYDSSGCKGYLASSCYPQSDMSMNFTLLTISDSSLYIPELFYNLLDSEDETHSNRYFYLVSGNTINIYNTNDASLYTSYINPLYTSNKIMCSPFFLREDYYSDRGYNLITLENTTSGYRIMISDMFTPGRSFAVLNSLIIENKTPVACDMYFPSVSGYYSILYSDGNISIYKINATPSNSIEYITTVNTGVNVQSSINFNYPDYSSPIILNDMNNDGYDDLVFAIPFSTSDGSYRYGNTKIGVYDIYHDTYILAPITKNHNQRLSSGNGAEIYDAVHVSAVKTGLSTSNYKIYVNTNYKYYNNVLADYYYRNNNNYVYNQAGDVLFNPNYLEYATGNYNSSNIVFTDYNFDGLIEACLFDYRVNGLIGNFSCYNSAFNKIFSASGEHKNSTYSPFISMMKLNDDDNMVFITRTGIYDFNASDTWNIYNLSYINYVYSMPAGLISKINYSNDIFSVYSTIIDMLQLKTEIVSCGDSICSPFENPLICPEDCFNQNGTLPQSPYLNPTLPCMNNSQCLSGQCIDYRCSYLSVNQACSVDAQCLSDQCTNGICEQSSLAQNLDQAKNEWFGYDDATSNLVALAITLVLSIAVMVIVALVCKSGIVAAVSGVLVMFGCLAFFTFVLTWINPILVFIICILIVGLVMLYIFMKSQGGR